MEKIKVTFLENNFIGIIHNYYCDSCGEQILDSSRFNNFYFGVCFKCHKRYFFHKEFPYYEIYMKDNDINEIEQSVLELKMRIRNEP